MARRERSRSRSRRTSKREDLQLSKPLFELSKPLYEYILQRSPDSALSPSSAEEELSLAEDYSKLDYREKQCKEITEMLKQEDILSKMRQTYSPRGFNLALVEVTEMQMHGVKLLMKFDGDYDEFDDDIFLHQVKEVMSKQIPCEVEIVNKYRGSVCVELLIRMAPEFLHFSLFCLLAPYMLALILFAAGLRAEIVSKMFPQKKSLLLTCAAMGFGGALGCAAGALYVKS